MLFQFLLYCFFLTPSSITHDVHLSLCTIELNTIDSTAFVNFRLFTDDLALAVQKPLLDDPKDTQYDATVINYLEQHFKITYKEIQKELFFFSRSANEEVFEISFLLTEIYEPKNIEIYNNIMLDEFDKQKNIIKLIHQNTKRQFIMEASNQILSL